MLDKLKQFAQLKALQDSVKQEFFSVEQEGIRVIINGQLTVREVVVNPALTAERQAQVIKECFNEALKQAQAGLAKKLSGLNLGF